MKTMQVTVSGGPCYRILEKRRIVAGILSGQSLLVVGDTGVGKTTLAREIARELMERNFKACFVDAGAPTLMLHSICEQAGIELTRLDGRRKANNQLRDEIKEIISEGIGILIFDNAERYDVKFRAWIGELIDCGCAVLLVATNPPKKDIFIKVPRIELEPLGDKEIREIMLAEADKLGLKLKRGDIASWQARVAGNPLLAKKAIREEYLGIEPTADHTQWIDGTPFMLAFLSGITILRFLGLGFNSTSLYLMGAILTVSVGVIRLIYYSLPKHSSRIGR